MRGVCADEVAVNFSAVSLAYRLTLSNSASCYKTNIVPTEKFTLLQLSPRVKLTDNTVLGQLLQMCPLRRSFTDLRYGLLFVLPFL